MGTDEKVAGLLREFSQYPVSQPKRKVVHQQGNQKKRLTIAAGGVIFAHNKILLDRSDNTDLWSIPGGSIRFNESAERAVKREIKEELNLNVQIEPQEPFVFHFELETDGFLDQIYLLHFLVKVEKPVHIMLGGNTVDYRWEPVSSLFRDCYPNVKAAVDHYLKIT